MRMTMLLGCGALLAALAPAHAQSPSGELRCTIKGGFGVVIAANRAVSCSYRRPGLPTEFYSGSTGNIGIDIGPTNARAVTYQVLTSDPAAPAALQGEFAGPGFAASAGAGIAGSALVGGSGVTLVPIPNKATTAATGLNFNAGLNQLSLQFAAVEQMPEPRRTPHRIYRTTGSQ